MCLLAVAWEAHAHYPLVIVSNRDEVHSRPTASAEWWPHQPNIVGGRDSTAGGSWLAMTRQGRVAVIMNYPGRALPTAARVSRGELVTGWLTTKLDAHAYLDHVQTTETRYSGFILVIGGQGGWHCVVSPHDNVNQRRTFARGVLGVSNSPPDAPWPKARFLQAALTQCLRTEPLNEEYLFDLLATRSAVGPADSDFEAISLVARTPFILGRHYGTRASTLILVAANGDCRFKERRFDAEGRLTGESTFEFPLLGSF